MNIANIKMDSFSIVGITTRTSNSDEFSGAGKIADLWQKFYSESIINIIQEKISEKVFAVYHDYESDASAPYTLMIGMMVNKDAAVPQGLFKIDIPAQDYTQVTSSKGAMPENIVKAWQEVWKLTEENEIKRSYTFDFEIYDERASDPKNAVIDILIAKDR